eukprot:jgi/Botrbrau1/18501/Bobra.0072s0080.1
MPMARHQADVIVTTFPHHLVALRVILLEVTFVDPRSIIPLLRTHPTSIGSVSLLVPKTFLGVLERGAEHELGEADDPMNSWIFGKRGEIFELRFVGTIPCQSGYACATSGSPTDWSSLEADLPWSTLKQKIDDGLALPSPIIWAGKILETPEASIYVKMSSEASIEGIKVTSSDELG